MCGTDDIKTIGKLPRLRKLLIQILALRKSDLKMPRNTRANPRLYDKQRAQRIPNKREKSAVVLNVFSDKKNTIWNFTFGDATKAEQNFKVYRRRPLTKQNELVKTLIKYRKQILGLGKIRAANKETILLYSQEVVCSTKIKHVFIREVECRVHLIPTTVRVQWLWTCAAKIFADYDSQITQYEIKFPQKPY